MVFRSTRLEREQGQLRFVEITVLSDHLSVDSGVVGVGGRTTATQYITAKRALEEYRNLVQKHLDEGWKRVHAQTLQKRLEAKEAEEAEKAQRGLPPPIDFDASWTDLLQLSERDAAAFRHRCFELGRRLEPHHRRRLLELGAGGSEKERIVAMVALDLGSWILLGEPPVQRHPIRAKIVANLEKTASHGSDVLRIVACHTLMRFQPAAARRRLARWSETRMETTLKAAMHGPPLVREAAMSIVSGVAARGLKSFTPAFRRRWLRHIRKLVRDDLDRHSQLYFEWKRLDPKKAFRFLLEEADFASLKSEEASLIVELREAAPNDARAMNRLRAVASLRSPVGREAQRELGSLDPKQLTVNVRRWAKRWRQERNRDALTNLYDYYLLKRITVSTRRSIRLLLGPPTEEQEGEAIYVVDPNYALMLLFDEDDRLSALSLK